MTHGLACPVSGCRGQRRNSSMLMCWPCWRRVPRILQNAVWDQFRAYERSATVESVQTLREAQQTAIKAVETKNAEANR